MESKYLFFRSNCIIMIMERTPLHSAVARSKDDIVPKLLLQKGGDICNRSVGGRTPMHNFFRETSRALLTSHGDFMEIDAEDDYGMIPLHYIAWSSKSTVADIQPFLVGNISRLFAKDHAGRSILFFAAERGNVAILEYLLSLPAKLDLSATDAQGISLIHYAVRSRRVKTIDVLYSHGCNIQAVDRHERRTALHHAAIRGNLEAVERLIELSGIEQLSRTDIVSQTPLDLAKVYNKPVIAEYLTSISAPSADASPARGKVVFCTGHRDGKQATTMSTSRGQNRSQRYWFTLDLLGLIFGIIVLTALG